MGQISNALNLKAQSKNQDRVNTDGCFLAVKYQLLPCLRCTKCLFSLPKEREGWKCSSGFAQTALVLWMKEYIALKHWKALAESGLLHVFLRACAVLNCSAGFREELHLLCQSSLSRCSCVEEAMLRVAGRVHPAGGKHCLFLEAMGRMRERKIAAGR